MICPECKAEFRYGFTQCSDCGIALVDVPPNLDNRFRAIPETAPAEFNELLVCHKDCRFYLGLLGSLASFRVRCYGKAANPVTSGSGFSSAAPEFEIWVPREQSPLATWIRDSYQEDWIETQNLDLEDEQSTLGTATEAPDSAKLCALCSAEYTAGTTLCENCGTTLFWGNQVVPKNEVARVLFSDAQPQICGALRVALLEQRIPFDNALLYRDGILRPNSPASSTEILVRDADFDRGTQVLAHLLERYEFEPSPALRLPVNPADTYWPHFAERDVWLPQDLTAVVWTGHNYFRLSAATYALREHKVPYRSETENPKEARLLVHPEDQSRAREILRNLEEGPDSNAAESLSDSA